MILVAARLSLRVTRSESLYHPGAEPVGWSGGCISIVLKFVVTVPSSGDLQRLRTRLVELTNRALVAVIVADHVGLIAHVDAPLAQALGWRAHELAGRPLATIIPPHLRDAHHLGFSRFLMTHQPTLLERRLTLSVATRAGSELSAEHVITAIRIETGWLFAAAIRLQDSHAG